MTSVEGSFMNLVFPISFHLVDSILSLIKSKVSVKAKIIRYFTCKNGSRKVLMKTIMNYRKIVLFGILSSFNFILDLLFYLAMPLIIFYVSTSFTINGYFCRELRAKFLVSDSGKFKKYEYFYYSADRICQTDSFYIGYDRI